MIALVEYVLLPAAALRGNREFRVERRDEEPLVYSDINKLREDYKNDIVRSSPCLFKSLSLTRHLIVDPTTTQACRLRRTCQPHGTHSGGVPSLP